MPTSMRTLFAAVCLATGMAGAARSEDCVKPGEFVAFVPQQEGWSIGSIGGTVGAGGCTYDLAVTKDWTIRLRSEGPVRISLETRGNQDTDPSRPVKAFASGTVRIKIRPSVPGTGGAEYKLVMDLRKPGL